MSYSIMRIQKIKSMQGLVEREKHNTRCKTVFTADGSNNIITEGYMGLVGHLKKLEREIDKNNKRKTRKDAVKTIEVLFTSDKSFFEKVNYEEYFALCKEWLEETFETSVLWQYSCHLDENTPHLHCIISTIKDGKFNYSGYVNGRKDLRALQDSFFAKVGHLGLERGQRVELTKETYISNREWNKNITKTRSFAESLAPSQQLEYAIKGIMYTEKIEKLHNENRELRVELEYSNENYRNLKEGFYNSIKGNSETRALTIDKLKQQGKIYLDRKAKALIPPTLEEIGL